MEGFKENTKENPNKLKINTFLKSILERIPSRVTEKEIDKDNDLSNVEKTSDFIRERNTLIYSFLKKELKMVLKIASLAYLMYLSVEYANQLPPGKYSEKDRAKNELEKNGVTKEQASAYKWGTSDLLYKAIGPEYYPTLENLEKIVTTLPDNLSSGREDNPTFKMMKPSEDAWAMYLGLPQKYGTFDISDDKPSDSKEDMYYYKIKDEKAMADIFYDAAMHFTPDIEKRYLETKDTLGPDLRLIHELLVGDFEKYKLWKIKEYAKYLRWLNRSEVVRVKGAEGHMLENVSISSGEDEKGEFLALYDIWDFNFASEQLSETYGGLGRPFEIYQRLYFNSDDTFNLEAGPKN